MSRKKTDEEIEEMPEVEETANEPVESKPVEDEESEPEVEVEIEEPAKESEGEGDGDDESEEPAEPADEAEPEVEDPVEAPKPEPKPEEHLFYVEGYGNVKAVDEKAAKAKADAIIEHIRRA